MRRILSVIHFPIYSGLHNLMLRMNAPFAKRGWDLVVLLPDEPGNAAGRLRAARLNVEQMRLHRPRARLNPLLNLNFVLRFAFEVGSIRRLIRKYQIDLVHVFGLLNIQGAVAARLEDVPLVGSLNSTFIPRPLRCLLMPVMSRLADVVMSEGMGVAKEFPGAAKLGDRLILFFPGVDTAEFCPNRVKRLAARAELGVPDNAILVGTVGNFNKQKGHEFFVRSAAIVCREFPNVFFRILGAHVPTNADYYERIVKREAHKLGLIEGDRLRFVEPGERVADLLSGFDIFLLTSRAEGVATATLEAMSCGLPIVATNVGSVREVVEDGITGFVVPPFDHEMIAKATLKLLRTPHLRVRMGEVARRRAVERYDVKVCVDTHLRAYEAAIAHHLSCKRVKN